MSVRPGSPLLDRARQRGNPTEVDAPVRGGTNGRFERRSLRARVHSHSKRRICDEGRLASLSASPGVQIHRVKFVNGIEILHLNEL